MELENNNGPEFEPYFYPGFHLNIYCYALSN